MGDAQSSPQITDINHIKKDFTELNSPTKIHALLEMVKICSHQEQCDFQEKLMALLCKDFLTDLPADLAARVISHLSMVDTVTCLLVSKSWYKVVAECSSYWNAKARELGMAETFVTSFLSSSGLHLHSLCVASQSHQTYIRTLTPRCYPISDSPTGIRNSFHYAGNGVILRYEEMSSQARVIIECMNTTHSSVFINSFDVAPFKGRIKWASASLDYVLWKQMDGRWCGYNTKVLVSELDIWEDEPLVHSSQSISFCSKCHVVAVLSQAEDDCEVWDLQVIKLYNDTVGSNTLRKMVYPIPLDGVKQLLTSKRYFLGGEMTLLPTSLEIDEAGFCKFHSVLLQIDSNLAIHKLKMIEETDSSIMLSQLLPNSLLSKPLKVFSPKPVELSLNLMELSGSKSRAYFCLSGDLERVAVIQDNYLYVWNLETFEEEHIVDLSPLKLPSDCEVKAIGSMYTVVASSVTGMCAVLLTSTGNVILQTSVAADLIHKHDFVFYGPLNQDWLNGFVYFNFLPLCLVSHCHRVEDKEELELRAVVGLRKETMRFY